MITFLLAAAVLTADPGSAIQVRIPNEPRLNSLQVVWQEKKVPAFQSGDVWTTILGVDLDVKPGEYRGAALLTMDDGAVVRREITISVLPKKFPTRRLKVAARFINLSEADVKRVDRESKETEAIYGRITPDLVPGETFTVPIPGRTGTNFGERRIFNGEPRAPHSGADLRATAGTPVQATNRGRVVLAKDLFFTGNTVILDHGLGIYSLYAHLSRLDVKRDDIAEKGQIVGLVGATGRVTAPHLHWGMRVQGARVDPFSLIGLGDR